MKKESCPMTHEDAKKAKAYEEKLKEQKEEKTDDIEQTKQDVQNTLD